MAKRCKVYSWDILEQWREWLNTFEVERPSLVLGILRGGLVPAVMMSHEKGIDMQVIDPDLLSFTDFSQYRRVYIVDEIIDTGHTVLKIWQKFKRQENILFLSLTIKERGRRVLESREVPYCSCLELTTNQWIVFPWEARWFQQAVEEHERRVNDVEKVD